MFDSDKVTLILAAWFILGYDHTLVHDTGRADIEKLAGFIRDKRENVLYALNHYTELLPDAETVAIRRRNTIKLCDAWLETYARRTAG